MNNSNIIIAGDMNLVLDTCLDKSASAHTQQSKSSHVVRSALKNMNMVDTWRLLYPTGRAYCFFSSVHGSYSRIDYSFLDSKLIPIMRDVTYHPILISDHSPVSIDLDFADLANLQRRNWRFDPTLLKDDTFHKTLEKHILDYINDNDKGDVNDAILWESMKAVIRGHIISFSAAKRKSQEMTLKDLESNIQQLEQTYQSSPKIELLGKITKITKLKCEYNSLLSKQACLQITKCKQTFFELGDKLRRLLARLLRKTQASQTILSINNEHGRTTRNPQQINKCFLS